MIGSTQEDNHRFVPIGLLVEGFKSRNRLHQLHGFHTKCMSKSDDVEQTDIAFAALDSSDIVSVQV